MHLAGDVGIRGEPLGLSPGGNDSGLATQQSDQAGTASEPPGSLSIESVHEPSGLVREDSLEERVDHTVGNTKVGSRSPEWASAQSSHSSNETDRCVKVGIVIGNQQRSHRKILPEKG